MRVFAVVALIALGPVDVPAQDESSDVRVRVRVFLEGPLRTGGPSPRPPVAPSTPVAPIMMPEEPSTPVAPVMVPGPPSPPIAPSTPVAPFRDSLASGGQGPLMAEVPAGRFQMGSTSGEVGRETDEGPVHEVVIPRFAAGVYEVTFDEWDACYNAGGCSTTPTANFGRGRQPVINVNWNDAQEYVAWLNLQTSATASGRYRLLSESEWEYAARAGTTTPFHTGSCIHTQQVNYDGRVNYNDCGANTGTYEEQTLEVGSFDANGFGLRDMHGNAGEWVEDCVHDDYTGAPTDGSAWGSENGGDCSRRVRRGGSWNSIPVDLRSAARSTPSAVLRSSNSGFRIARTLLPGPTFQDSLASGGQGPLMVEVPAGHFQMGSPDSELERMTDEGPIHEVVIPRFAAGVYEVTFDEWDACYNAGGCSTTPTAPYGRGRQPVIRVSWEDAQEYVAWLNLQTSATASGRYRLLSESEWEYAARAGTTTPFHTGSCIHTEQANYDGREDYNNCGANTGDNRARTLGVGSLAANGFGLYDMHGNVWEWVEDCEHGDYNNAPTDGSAWDSENGGDCSRRVLRGGSWVDLPENLRSANRSRLASDFRNNSIGFRIARTLPPGPTFQDSLASGGQGPLMIEVPAGRFQMGSTSGEVRRGADEGPVHEVVMPRFAAGVYEVTFDEWDACWNAGGCSTTPTDSWGRGRQPVIRVSWEDAQEYVAWLNLQTSATASGSYRLLSESEWEYAARAGTTTPFHTGSCIHTEQANYDGTADYNNCGANTGVNRQQTLGVGSLAANGFGLYDMHGNVWEWVEDCWHDDYIGAPTDGSAWRSQNGGDCSRRVLRGGSWSNFPEFLRSANRPWFTSGGRDFSFGFRIARTLLPGPTFQDSLASGGQGPLMMEVPAGRFQMGSTSGEVERDTDEGPVHEVVIPRFAAGVYEVTFDEWDACYNAGGCSTTPTANFGRGRQPVINVNWEDAQEYVAWLNLQTSATAGGSYHLLSESEWEYAARAGTTTPFHTGSCIHTQQANYDGTVDYNNCGANTGVNRQQTLGVGSLAANGFGLYDMHGNVWEWVEDCEHGDYNNAPTDGSAWDSENGGDCSRRVLRGGSWGNLPEYLRSANRKRNPSDARFNLFGFRIARTLP